MANLLKITAQRYYKNMKLPSVFLEKCDFWAKNSIFSKKSTIFVWLIQKKALPLPWISIEIAQFTIDNFTIIHSALIIVKS